MNIFECRSNPAELPVDKIVNADARREFGLSNGSKVYIGQFETVDLQAVLGREAEIREAIKALVAEKGYQFVLFFATDILAEGSQFICEGDTEFVNKVFGIDVTGKSAWMPGVAFPQEAGCCADSRGLKGRPFRGRPLLNSRGIVCDAILWVISQPIPKTMQKNVLGMGCSICG